ncbi:acetyltransferase, GNAT family [Methanosarcina sp. MTP4]|uniref:GNAT family N-acetyltransferase n=1 Tax=Methanosarcina sp. MTP4 TaxID=1434100 RepID=UPI0006158529|nr:GNAT family protein [Methanosarcina sp. MTP4]AKB25210.1 acetyltransferase, GNAT family [Methanosarcina sp. MTP4]
MKTKWIKDNISFSYCVEADLMNIASMLSKESVCKYMFFGPNKEEDTMAYFSPLVRSIEDSLKEDKIPDCHVFTIRGNSTGEFIGQCALLPIEFTNGNYLIGYQIDDTQWRKGYGTAACDFLVHYAFNVTDAFRLTGDCARGNSGSEKVMMRSGFQSEGRQRKYWSVGEKYFDRMLFSLLKEDVPESRLEELNNMYR